MTSEILLYVEAIDNKNREEIKNLIINGNNTNKKDVVYELYENNLLTAERLQFIIENCNNDLKISTPLIKRLIKDNSIEILQIIFKSIKFFDHDFILNLLFYYKNRKPLSSDALNQFISNEKYEISTDDNYYNESYQYLICACRSGKEYLAKKLI